MKVKEYGISQRHKINVERMSAINITFTFTLLMATEGLPRFTSDTSRSTNTDGTPCTKITVSCETCEDSLITKRIPIRSISV